MSNAYIKMVQSVATELEDIWVNVIKQIDPKESKLWEVSQKESLKITDLFNILDIHERNTDNIVNIATFSDIMCAPEIYLHLPNIRYRVGDVLYDDIVSNTEYATFILDERNFQKHMKKAILDESKIKRFYYEFSDFIIWMDPSIVDDEDYDSTRIFRDLNNLLHFARTGLAAVQDVETFAANVFANALKRFSAEPLKLGTH